MGGGYVWSRVLCDPLSSENVYILIYFIFDNNWLIVDETNLRI